MFLVDSHCHLNMLDLTPDEGELDRVIARANAAGVHHMLNVSVSLKEFPAVLRVAQQYDCVSASVGLHPNERAEEVTLDTLIDLAQSPKVIAIGETGLDYFRSEGDLGWQQMRFRIHIQAAKAVQKPLIIHTRQAQADTLRLMQEENAMQCGGVMHCFSEDVSVAEAALAMGFYISFSGIVTFKNAAMIQATAKYVPLDRMLIETDSPYLAPGPKRGKPNEPSYVPYVAEQIANLHGVTIEEVAEQTTHNFFALFKGAKRTHV